MNAHDNDLAARREYALEQLSRAKADVAAAKNCSAGFETLKAASLEMGRYVGVLDRSEIFDGLWAAGRELSALKPINDKNLAAAINHSLDEGTRRPVPILPPPVARSEPAAHLGSSPPAFTTVAPPTGTPGHAAASTAAQDAKETGSSPASRSLASPQPAKAAGTTGIITPPSQHCEAVGELRRALLARGFVPIAVATGGKKPVHSEWNTRQHGDADMTVTMNALNTGINCNGLRTIDIDVDDKARADQLRELALQRLGGAPIRWRGNSPRVLLLYRAHEGEPKKRLIISTTYKNDEGKYEKVEILGQGQQFVAHGIHPSGVALQWEPNNALEYSRDTLIAVTETQIDTFLAEAAKIIEATPRGPSHPPITIKHKGNRQTVPPIHALPPLTSEQIAHMENIAKCSLERIANAPRGTSNDTINKEARTLAGLVAAGLPANGLQEHALDVALKRAATGGNDPNETRRTFESGWTSGLASPWRPDAGMSAEAVEAVKASATPRLARLVADAPKGLPHELTELTQAPIEPSKSASVSSVSAPGRCFFRSDDVWPEPRPLPHGLLPVAPFDMGYLPASVSPWVADISDRMQCPPDFIGIPAIVALGSVIGRKIGIRPQRKTDWLEVANLWGFIVGRPGAMKSPAMVEALKPLSRLEAEARKENEAAKKEYAKELAHYKRAAVARTNMKSRGEVDIDLEEPEAPTERRYIVNDTSYEKLGETLAGNPNGVLGFRDELVSLLKTLDREECAAARGFYLTAWNGTSGYTFDRIIRGKTHIEAACLSLLGGTQPGRIAEYMRRAVSGGAGDDGLIQRFGLLVWPDQNPDWKEVDRYPDTDARAKAWDAFYALDRLDPDAVGAERDTFEAVPFLRFDDAAHGVFSEWRADLEARLRGEDMSPALEGHFAKYRKLVPALALVTHLADGGTGPVSQEATQRVIAFSAYLETHARRAYAAGTEAETAAAKAIVARIRKGDLSDGFMARDIRRKEWAGLADNDRIKAGLDLLTDLDWIAPTTEPTAGRPRTSYTINPRANEIR